LPPFGVFAKSEHHFSNPTKGEIPMMKKLINEAVVVATSTNAPSIPMAAATPNG
jgi:hypothetical protein